MVFDENLMLNLLRGTCSIIRSNVNDYIAHFGKFSAPLLKYDFLIYFRRILSSPRSTMLLSSMPAYFHIFAHIFMDTIINIYVAIIIICKFLLLTASINSLLYEKNKQLR